MTTPEGSHRAPKPSIVINGQELTPAQALAVRAAMHSVIYDFETNPDRCGNDAAGRRMQQTYLKDLKKVQALIAQDDALPTEWKDLTEREGKILEHAYNIQTGKPQRLIIEPGQYVYVLRGRNERTGSLLRATPTPVEVKRMRAYCQANASDFAVVEDTATGFTIRPRKSL